MEYKTLEKEIILPEGVEFAREGKEVTIKGPKGELKRKILDPSVDLEKTGDSLKLSFPILNKTNKRKLHTFAAHLDNMVRGVTEGYTYKLKICSGHFPMNVALKGDVVEIKNFIGESVPRKVKLKQGAEVKIDGDVINVTSTDKEIAGNTAGDLEKITRRKGFDKRIFQDGIYIIDKPKREIQK